MTSKIQSLGVALLATSCTGRADVCDGAKSGDACRWAGTGEQGLNRENPKLDRLDSLLNQPTHITFAPDGRAYITDWNNHMIRRVEHDQTLVRVVGTEYEGDGSPEMEDRLPVCAPAGIVGTDVALNHPTQTTFGPDGMLYIAAWHNNKIRALDIPSGIVKTVAGNFYGFTGDGGQACAATFSQPSSLVFGPDATLYIADQRNVRIRTITPDGVISTIAGDGHFGNVGDGGPMALAEFGWDTSDTPPVSGGFALADDTLYVADSGNNRIRRINLSTGIIDCIGGLSAQAGYSGDGGPAVDATFNWPLFIALGPDNRLYIADRSNHAVRAIDLATGQIETVVGNGTKCDTTVETCPDRALATEMQLNDPYGVAFDATGNLYVADTDNHRIIKVIR
jgi:sugar lactone lactonase YvrE